MIINLIYIIFAVGYVFLLPGYVLSKRYIKEVKDPLEIIGVSLALGITTIGTLSMISALVFNILFSRILVFGIATAIIVLYYKQLSLKLDKKKIKIFYLFFLFVFLFYLVRHDVRSTDWDASCLYNAVDKSIGAHDMIFVDGRIFEQFETRHFATSQKIWDNLYINGKASIEDQRLGNVALVAPFITLFNFLGFRLMQALLMAVVSILFYSLLNHIFKKEYISIIGAVLIAFNPFLLSLPFITEGIISLMLVLLVIYLLLKHNLFLAGFVFGALFGSRDVSILFIPAIVYYIGIKRYKKQIRFFLGYFISVSQYLVWRFVAFGNIFATPAIQEVNMVKHSFLGLNFNYPGLLNFPFYENIVRTISNPYPTFMIIPLQVIQYFGVLFIALAVMGSMHLFKKNRKLAIFLILWSVPFLLFFMLQENWVKYSLISYITLIMGPLFILITYGLKLFGEKNKIGINILLLGVIMLLIVGPISLARNLEFEQDPRTNLQYPHEENAPPKMLEYEKSVMTRTNILPDYSLANIHQDVFGAYRAIDLFDSLSRMEINPEPRKLMFKNTINSIELDFSKDIFSEKWAYPTQGNGGEIRNISRVLIRNVSFDSFNRTYDVMISKDQYIKIFINPLPHEVLNITEIISSNTIVLNVENESYIKVEYNALPDIRLYLWHIYLKGDNVEVSNPKIVFWA